MQFLIKLFKLLKSDTCDDNLNPAMQFLVAETYFGRSFV